MTDPDVKALAQRILAIEKGLAALGRSRQLTSSSIPVVVDGEEGPETVEMPLTTGVSQGVRAGAAAEEALAEARQAIEDAANALVTSNGKNSRRRGQTEPEPPEGGWVQGDQWVVDNAAGEAVEVRVWDGTEFVHETILTGELLVLSSGGVVRLADGVVTADAIAADAIDGMVITGAFLRTSAAGMRWEIKPAGIVGFDDTGTQRVTMVPSSQGLRITGDTAGNARISGNDMRVYSDSGNDVIFTNINAAQNSVVARRTLPGAPAGRSVGQLVTSGGSAAAEALFFPPGETVENSARLTAWDTGVQFALEAPGGSAWRIYRDRGASEVVVSGPRTRFANAVEFQAPVSFQGDSDWVSFYDLIGMSSPWTKRADGPFIRIRDGRAYMRGGVNNTTGYPSGWQAWPSLLPSMYRPKADVEFDVASPLASQTKAFRFNADGSINYYASASGNAPWLFDQCWWWLG